MASKGKVMIIDFVTKLHLLHETYYYMAEITLEYVNEVRKEKGLEPLTELPKKAKDPDDTKNEPPPPEDKKEEKNDPPPVAIELTDEQIVEALKKRGKEINSLEDLDKPPVAEDPKKLEEQREANKLAYALQKGIINKKQYESFVTDSNDPQNVVYREFRDQALNDDAELTDEDIQAEFAEKYGLSAEPGTRKHKRGQQEIALLADKIMREKHAKVYQMDDVYSKHEQEVNTKSLRENKILSEAPKFKADVEDIFSKELKTVKVQTGENQFFDIPVRTETLEKLKEKVYNPAWVSEQIEKGWKREELADILLTTLQRLDFNYFVSEGAKKFLEKNAKGSKGIPELGEKRKESSFTPQLTKEQQIMYDEMMAEKSKNQPALAN